MTADNNKLDRLRRIRFALFLKVLLRLIESDKLICDQVKLLVLACIREHRNGNNKHKNIMDAIELNLRGLVSGKVWRSARNYVMAFERQHSKNRNQLDTCGDQDLLEIEMLRPFVTRSGSDGEDYNSNTFHTCAPPKTDNITSMEGLESRASESSSVLLAFVHDSLLTIRTRHPFEDMHTVPSSSIIPIAVLSASSRRGDPASWQDKRQSE